MNIGKMMKDLQGMQAKMQEQIETIEVEGSSGGGAVSARMNGKKQLVSIKLASDSVSADDVDLLEDLIVAAVNDASNKVDEELGQMTKGLAGGLNLPGLG